MPLKDYDDKINEEFNGLKILSIDDFVEKGKRKKCTTLCLKCGRKKRFDLHKVLACTYKSCGCEMHKRVNMKRTDYSQYIGKVILGYKILSHINKQRLFEVQCEVCGTIKRLDRYKLANEDYGECECQRFHNQSKSNLYNRWKGIKNRCLNPNASSYRHYGGRGIKICDRWKDNFTAFLEDVGEPPTPKHQLDRIDNNGDYEPSNCRWVIPLQNVNNQREKNNNKTGYPNVYKKRNKYEACFQFNKEYHHVGTFDNPKEAYKACVEAKQEFLQTVSYNDIV
ncbi:hypothetical protein [Staphylococcus hyicus]|uniref:hypothetical protein n=1 Tax=Staphylococcus hyicus TaxID=1284 RepID=UPI0023658BD7|nr:hypothetical protein [Staphylococcus hyicus]